MNNILGMKFLCVTIMTFTVFLETISVRFKVVGPTEPLVVDAGSDLVLPCSLQPTISAEDMIVEWLRPDLTELERPVLSYSGFEDKTEKQFRSYGGRTALFKEKLQTGNTSLKLSAVQPSDEGVYKCLVTSKTWYDDFTVYVEVKEKVLDATKIAIICISVSSILLIASATYVLTVKFYKKQLSPLQCSAITYMHLKSENVRRELYLNKYNTSEKGFKRLVPAVTKCKKAIFSDCNLTKPSVEALASAIQVENSSLKHLDLSNNNLWNSGLEKLSAGLNSSQCKIEELRLAECMFDAHSCVILQSFLKSENSLLRELDLSYNNLSDSGVQMLSFGLKSSHCKLEILRLAGCKLTAESWISITSAIQTENLPLKELDLSNNDLNGVELLCDGLKNSKLEVLTLAICNLGENTCEKLSSALQLVKFPLKKLDLSNNDLGDSGVKLLCDGLRHCELEVLRLSGCLITEDGCRSLASALSSNPSHLKELDLTYNNPGEQGAMLLSAKQEDQPYKLYTLRLENAGEIMIKPGLRKYACELTLDPNTAHPCLTLSEEYRRVARNFRQQSYPNHPERFEGCKQVMCRESLIGRCYWEVEWSGLAFIAVTYRRIKREKRNNDCWFGHNMNSWSLYRHDNTYFASYNSNQTVIPGLSPVSNRVGVYLDRSAGTLSFYSVSFDKNTQRHLHTFQSTFTEPLYAGFWLGTDSSVRLCSIP